MLCYKYKQKSYCSICGDLASGKLLPSLKEAAAVWLVEFSCATLTKSLKEAAAVWLVEFSCALLPSP